MKEKMKEELDDFRNWNSLVELLSERVKELEDNIPDPEWCCEKHKATLVARIKKLEEGIGKVLQWRNFDGDGISDPLRQELYKLVEKEKP